MKSVIVSRPSRIRVVHTPCYAEAKLTGGYATFKESGGITVMPYWKCLDCGLTSAAQYLPPNFVATRLDTTGMEQ
jgi:hypothetical protein